MTKRSRTGLPESCRATGTDSRRATSSRCSQTTRRRGSGSSGNGGRRRSAAPTAESPTPRRDAGTRRELQTLVDKPDQRAVKSAARPFDDNYFSGGGGGGGGGGAEGCGGDPPLLSIGLGIVLYHHVAGVNPRLLIQFMILMYSCGRSPTGDRNQSFIQSTIFLER